ncbi:MAG: hypothetical protein IIU42_06450 [Ruminococcus sp.]|jgi:hypothetical protein|nr:hypothetical protein [Ruminococcus sp.]MBQ5382263.1 hypothetical protein [Ruminococcus sp.]MBQ5688147.1 hypothetical protein [Ruminococcus sp.]
MICAVLPHAFFQSILAIACSIARFWRDFLNRSKTPCASISRKAVFVLIGGQGRKNKKPLENIENMFYNLSIEFCAEVIE